MTIAESPCRRGGACYISAWSYIIAPKRAGGNGAVTSPRSSQRRGAANRPNGAQVATTPLQHSLLPQQQLPCVPSKALRQVGHTRRCLDNPKDVMVVRVLRVAGRRRRARRLAFMTAFHGRWAGPIQLLQVPQVAS